MINNLHPTSLKFTVERETDNRIAFLDMEIHSAVNLVYKIYSYWVNYEFSFTATYEIHLIFRACNNYETFHESLQKTKVFLEKTI